ncbi:MAG: amidase [Opitutaceae bacterium]|nr:amidase [Opitutaceae bacterium]|tara:strand:- start:2440 stop:3723 length:1284 start_codon:yes stop_codon:yes gene_type:complete
MISKPYWSISDWSDQSKKDPKAAADLFFKNLGQMPDFQVGTHISKTLSRKKLGEALAISSENSNLPLAGVPYLLKDLYDVAGWETNASSLFLNRVRGTPRKSSALENSFAKAGGVFAGKTHLVEFAYGMEGTNSHFGRGLHPHFPDRVSGGSSSGSVWAVAAGLVPLASGSDTGGSVRVPAAYNGLYGLRVTPDHPWSKEGCFPLSPKFDTAGWFTRTAEEMSATIDALFDDPPVSDIALRGLELLPGFSFIDNDLTQPHQKAVDSLSLTIDPEITKTFKTLPDLANAYLVISSLEASVVHKDWYEQFKDQYDPQTWKRIAVGNERNPEELEQANNARTQVIEFFKDLFTDYDYIVLPAAPVPAPKHGESTELRSAHLQLTAPASLLGSPVLTLPYFTGIGLSGGLQIIVPDLSARALGIWKRILKC